MVFAQRLYSVLLSAYPARLRAEFGAEMLRLFSDQRDDARRRQRTGRLYLQILLDWLRTVPAEHYSEYRRRPAADRRATPVHRVFMHALVFAPNMGVAVLIATGIFGWRGLRKLLCEIAPGRG